MMDFTFDELWYSDRPQHDAELFSSIGFTSPELLPFHSPFPSAYAMAADSDLPEMQLDPDSEEGAACMQMIDDFVGGGTQCPPINRPVVELLVPPMSPLDAPATPPQDVVLQLNDPRGDSPVAVTELPTVLGKRKQVRMDEPVYSCAYCGKKKTSTSTGSDGRVRIRCKCGGKHADKKARMHANWKRVVEVKA